MSIWDNISLFGHSRSEYIGITAKNIAAGIKIDYDLIDSFIKQRASGRLYCSKRKESDSYQIISGINNSYTTGETICIIVKNDKTIMDNSNREYIPRPSHADITASYASKFNANLDGGGAYSGRISVGLCILAAIIYPFLQSKGINIHSKLSRIGRVYDSQSFNPLSIDKNAEDLLSSVYMLDEKSSQKAQQDLQNAIREGDSLSSGVECVCYGLPMALGGEFFDGIEPIIAQGIYSIPGIKGLRFGADCASLYQGSKYNDIPYFKQGVLSFKSNNLGGVQGGRTNTMPLILNCDFKATPSIAKPQETVNLKEKTNVCISIAGDNDPCIGIRGRMVVKSCLAVAIYYLMRESDEN